MVHHNDLKYMMTLKDKKSGEYIRVYNYYGLNCLQLLKNQLFDCEYDLDSTFLSYLNRESILIISMRKECIDTLMDNIYIELEENELNQDFILYNARGIVKLLNYCGHNSFSKKEKLNRYVIHYLTHRLNGKRRRNGCKKIGTK